MQEIAIFGKIPSTTHETNLFPQVYIADAHMFSMFSMINLSLFGVVIAKK